MYREDLIEAIVEAVHRRAPYQILQQRWGSPRDDSYEGLGLAHVRMINALRSKAKAGNKAAKNVLRSRNTRDTLKHGRMMRRQTYQARNINKPTYKQLSREDRVNMSKKIEDTFRDIWQGNRNIKQMQDMEAFGSGNTQAVNFGGLTRHKLDTKN